MAEGPYGFDELAKDVIAEPAKRCIEEVTKELLAGKRLSSIDVDLANLWETAREAIESAFSAGLVFALIRFVSSLISLTNREPAYYENIQIAKFIYAEYGDSRWKGIKNLWWRFSTLKDADLELIRAQCRAQKDEKHMDVARIVLLRGLLAQAAGVWSEADRLFRKFVLTAKETIEGLDVARKQNQEGQQALEKRLTADEKALVEKLLGDARLAAAISDNKVDRLIQSLSGRLNQEARKNIGGLALKRVQRRDLEKRLQGLHTFIAYCNYRPTIRDAIDYRIERIQVYIGHSQFFAKLTDPQRNFVVRALGGMRRRHRRPTFSKVQKQAGLLK
jgi:hypothetical protein